MSNITDMIKIDKTSPTPLYLQLYGRLKNMLETGVMPADTRLPSVRSLSEKLGVNQVTVVSAYRRLENEGFTYSRPGSGTYAADLLNSIVSRAERLPPTLQDELYQQDDLAFISDGQVSISEATVNFASATPASELFPVDDFKIALDEALDRDKGKAFSYQEGQGYPPLRESISGILKSPGLACVPEDIHVISGAQQGIDIISKALLRPGDRIITESPTYTGAVAVFKSRDAQIVDIPMETGGPDMNLLEYNIRKHKPVFFYTIPSFQNPTGCSYTNEKRLELLGLAEKYGFHIIEDDYVSDLDFEGRSYMPLKALDRHDRVILVKSFSKMFMPGLRLGFMMAPSGVSAKLLAAKHTTDISTSGLIQRAFDLYIRKGFWDRHFNFMFRTYCGRYQKITSALDRCSPDGCTYVKPGGGLNLWYALPYGFPINSLLARAAANDIAFAPGSIFYSGNSAQAVNNIRLSFAAVEGEKIEAGVEKLCSLIGRLLGGERSRRSMPIL
jgi:2-aminoadipate transaminase